MKKLGIIYNELNKDEDWYMKMDARMLNVERDDQHKTRLLEPTMKEELPFRCSAAQELFSETS